MKVTAIELARSIWLIPAREINPYGKSTILMVSALIDRYKFADVPNIVQATKDNAGYEFKQGVFNDPKRGQLTAQLQFHTDGLVADTRTDTEASDAFLEDFFSWLKSEFELEPPQRIRKQYASTLYIQTETNLQMLNPKLAGFSKRIAEKSTGIPSPQFEPMALSFGTEQRGPIAPAQFKFERAQGVPYSDNIYFSAAPTTTADHIELLEELEALFG